MSLFHLVPRSEWEAAGPEYRPESLAAEGFVHCSYADQVAGTRERYYADVPDLLVLEIEPAGLDVRVEDSYGSGTAFPHVYGPIPRSAVTAVGPADGASPGR